MTAASASRRWLRRGFNVLAAATGVIGGLYLLVQFSLSKFNEFQERLLRDRVARENLRRRFLQNQEDCSFTIMALLPTLAAQIFERMNVEGISKELQVQSKRVAPILEYIKEIDEAEQREAMRVENERLEAERLDKERRDAEQREAEQRARQAAENTNADGEQGDIGTAGATDASADVSAGVSAADASAADASAADASAADASAADAPAADASSKDGEFAPADPQKQDRMFEQPPPPIHEKSSLTDADADAASGTNSLAKRPSQAEIDASVAAFEDERRAIKVKLWNQIKITSLSRLITSLYALALLALQTHIQLNLIGRRTYISSLEATVRDDPEQHHKIELHGPGVEAGEDDEQARTTDRQYLTCSWWFLHHGWKVIAERVEQAVADEAGEMPLRTLLSGTHLRELVQRIRERIEAGDGASSTYGYEGVLLPAKPDLELEMLHQSGALYASESVSPQLRQLLDETNDYIDSPDFARVLGASLNRVFEQFHTALAPSFVSSTVETPLLLAKALPLIAQQAQVACHSSPNEYVDSITESPELRALSVLIYSSWDDELE
ncbi:peroxin [Malassezia cuniculi]|uniref:Peroxin n=1 Tax=Malassezia cuniculi TaxID=948313 RepID=A0AAF0EUB0_9BASI|nr:peroxin [Malassezia cuniculi]